MVKKWIKAAYGAKITKEISWFQDDGENDDDDANSCDSSLPRPDGIDDDEDRIPEELLLKYTKPGTSWAEIHLSQLSIF